MRRQQQATNKYPEWEYDEEPGRCLNRACLWRWAKEVLLWVAILALFFLVFMSLAKLYYRYDANYRVSEDLSVASCSFLDEADRLCDRAEKEARYGHLGYTSCDKARDDGAKSLRYTALEMTIDDVKEYFFPSEVSWWTTLLVLVSIMCLAVTTGVLLVVYVLCVRGRRGAGSTYFIGAPPQQQQRMYAQPSKPKWEYEDEGSESHEVN